MEIFRFDNGHQSCDHMHIFEKIKPFKFISIGHINDELYELINKYRGEIDEIKIHGNNSNE